MVRRCVRSRNLVNEEALAHCGMWRQKQTMGSTKELQLLNKQLCVLHSCFSNVPFRTPYWTRPRWQGSIYCLLPWFRLVTLSPIAHVLEPLTLFQRQLDEALQPRRRRQHITAKRLLYLTRCQSPEAVDCNTVNPRRQKPENLWLQ